MKTAVLLALVLTAPAFATTSSDNCDIAVQPAATLLLPYFEVDLQGGAVQTLFTVQNVSRLPQIAHVTLWTDWGYPVLDFSIFLTGYDVQGINLYDVLSKGLIAPPGGTSSATPVPVSFVPGGQPAQNDANLNFLPGAVAACAQLPGRIPPSLLADVQAVFTRARTAGGQLGCASTQLGSVHQYAIGYAMIDVVATCTAATGSSSSYFNSVLLYDNVLTGDYQIVRANDGYAEGGPLVHMRAIPEGGAAGTLASGALPYTFYDRYTKFDRRQPLPPAFAPRVIQGGAGSFRTSVTIWREGIASGSAACKDYVRNSGMPVAGIVRFDEHENATMLGTALFEAPPYGTPVAFSPPSTSGYFPATSTSGDAGGWMLLDLDNGAFGRPSQNWVTVTMIAPPAFATSATAAAVRNACAATP